MTLTVISRIRLADRPWNFLFDRPAAQTRRKICACDISKFSALCPLLALDILTLKTYDLDSHFQGQRWKKYILVQNTPKNRKIWTILSFCIRTSGGKISSNEIFIFKVNFSIFLVSPILTCDTSFCSSWSALNVYRILTLKMHDLNKNKLI
jgi:hypothetical protein